MPPRRSRRGQKKEEEKEEEEQQPQEVEDQPQEAAEGEEQPQEQAEDAEMSEPAAEEAVEEAAPEVQEEAKEEVQETKEEEMETQEEAKPEQEAEEEPPAKKQKTEEEEKEEEKEKEPEEPKERKVPAELVKFWKAVQDDPKDFTGWTYLLQYVDSAASEATHTEAREAYDAFLNRYPYCYGYWKKYADYEKRNGGAKEKAMMVFERGIAAIPLSVDLWIHYLNHVNTEYADNKEYVRAQYERAMYACGREWRSDKLWDKYVKWEVTEAKDLCKALKLYDRIIRNPTQGLSHQFDMFRDFVKEHNPKDMLDVDEFLAMRKEVLAELSKDGEKKEKKEEEDESAAPGEEGEGDSEKPATDEENSAMREKMIFSRKKAFKAAEEEVQARWKYEDNIKRPYFHMKPLERGQLKNWGDYLDFEIKRAAKEGGDARTVEVLFERCLIACALYEEFWAKYAEYLEGRKADDKDKDDEKIRDVYRRATTHHLPDKLDIHLKYAGFEERRGEFGRAAEILRELEQKHHPEMLNLMLRRINLERRRGNVDAVHELYSACIAKGKNKATKTALSIK